MANAASQLDTRVEIVTPENIAFHYRVAGPFRRLPAFLIDLLVRSLILFVLSLAFLFTLGSIGAGGMAVGLLALSWFVLSWFYGGLFESFWNGQTPGKRAMGLRVLTVDGRPINALQAVLRNILRSADMLPVVSLPIDDDVLLPPFLPLYMLGLIVAMMNRRYQRLGDLACGTMVVIDQRDLHRGVIPVSDREAIELAQRLPVNFPVHRSLARALANYMERRRHFSPARREEIARTLGEPLQEQLHLPEPMSHDVLLAALYYRTFIADRGQDDDLPPSGDTSLPVLGVVEPVLVSGARVEPADNFDWLREQ